MFTLIAPSLKIFGFFFKDYINILVNIGLTYGKNTGFTRPYPVDINCDLSSATFQFISAAKCDPWTAGKIDNQGVVANRLTRE